MATAKAVTVQQSAQVIPADQFLMRAVESNAAPETIEKMMDLKERWEAGEAKKAFFRAMQKFQGMKPDLPKTSQVSFGQGKTAYNFCPLSEIEKRLREPLGQCGLSYRFENGSTPDSYSVTCIVSHVDGHSERTTMSAPADSSGNKNAIQGIGSTSTYLMRYTLIAAFALTTADEDNDGASNSDLPYARVLKQNQYLQDVNNLNAIVTIKQALAEDDHLAAYEIMVNMSDDMKGALWLASTKGGIFTTKETAQMKSDEFGAARRKYHEEQES